MGGASILFGGRRVFLPPPIPSKKYTQCLSTPCPISTNDTLDSTTYIASNELLRNTSSTQSTRLIASSATHN